ncbi:hypothetical protein AtNW77_Chr3g0194431 [Arabidopsis thaliana]
MDFGHTMKALRSKKKLELKPHPDLKGVRVLSLFEDTKTKTHTNFDYTIKALRSEKKLELKPQPDLKSVRIVSLLENTKPKTHTDFGYTMKALRSKKKCFLVRRYKAKDSYGLWLHHESFEKLEEAWLVFWKLKPQPDLKSVRIVSLLEDTKLKTHTDFGYTMKALRSKKKCFLVRRYKAKDSYGLWLHHESFEKLEEACLSTVSLLEDTKPKTHMDFGYTMKSLRSKKKVG